MKKNQIKTICILCAFLIATNINAQIPTKTIKPKGQSIQQVTIPKTNNIQNAQSNLANAKKYFKILKVGQTTQKGGQQTLKAVDTNFPEINQTKKTKVGTKNTAKEICVIEKIDVNVKTRNFKSFPIDGAPDWLKPGVVMKAQDFISANGKMEESFNRSPITLSTSLTGSNVTTYVEVPNPKQRHLIRDAENRLISQGANPVNANMTFSYYEVSSLEEIEYKLTGRFSGGFGAFGASMDLNYGSKKSYHYYVIEFNQTMFSISVNSIDANNLFTDSSIPTEDYIYLSKVNYGRRGLIVFKSTKTISELESSYSVNFNSLINKGEFNTAYNKLIDKSEVDIKLYFYGGTPESAIKSMEKTVDEKKPDLFNFIKASAANHKVALPISYEIKNLDNQVVGLENNMSQSGYETCIPKRNFKLKVTLVDLQCIEGRDGGGNNPDDYAIQQYIGYRANKNLKTKSSGSINVFPNRKDGPVQVANQPNILISGDANNQLHVKQGRNRENRGNVINNSLVFNISYEEFMDPNAEFKIFTWVKEYSNKVTGANDDKVLAANTATPVKIKEVLEILAGVRTLDAVTPFSDGQIGKDKNGKALFHDFGTGFLMLDNIQKLQSRMVLEGPIKIGSAGEKAAAWISFELVD